MKNTFSLLLVFLLGASLTLFSQDKDDSQSSDDEDPFANLESLEDEGDPFSEIENLDVEDVKIEERSYRISGDFVSSLGYSPQRKDDIDWSKMRLSALLKLDYNLNPQLDFHSSVWSFYDFSYDHHGESKFDDRTLEEYQSQNDLYELYFNYKFNSKIKMKVGRQIIVWGNSEVDRVLDIVTPLDQREIGTKDIGDQRLPAAAAKLSGFFDPWQIELVALPEVRPDLLPEKDSGFDQLPALRGPNFAILNRERPETSWKNIELALKIKRLFHNGDISLVAASVFDDQPHLEYIGFNGSRMVLQPEYERSFVYGVSAAYSSGPILWKAEAVNIKDKALGRNDLFQQFANTGHVESWRPRTVSRCMVGVEYSGIESAFASLEYIGQVVHNHKNYLSARQHNHSVGAVFRHNSLNDTLETSFTSIYSFDDGGGLFFRVGFDYEWSQNTRVGMNYTFFDSVNAGNPAYSLRNSDRIDLIMTYQY